MDSNKIQKEKKIVINITTIVLISNKLQTR